MTAAFRRAVEDAVVRELRKPEVLRDPILRLKMAFSVLKMALSGK